MSTLAEIRALFGIEDGNFYRVIKNKSDQEMLQDAGQSISTFAGPTGRYILVQTDFSHPDYTKVE